LGSYRLEGELLLPEKEMEGWQMVKELKVEELSKVEPSLVGLAKVERWPTVERSSTEGLSSEELLKLEKVPLVI